MAPGGSGTNVTIVVTTSTSTRAPARSATPVWTRCERADSRAQHPPGVGVVDGLAEDLAVDLDDRVGGQHRVTVDGAGLGGGQPPHEGERPLARLRRLVDVGRHDVERQPELGQQLPPPRRPRGQHEPEADGQSSGSARQPVQDEAGPARRQGPADRAGDDLAGGAGDGGLGDGQPRQAQRPAGPARQQGDGGGGDRQVRRAQGDGQRRVGDEEAGGGAGRRRAGQLGPVGLEHGVQLGDGRRHVDGAERRATRPVWATYSSASAAVSGPAP